MFQYISKDFAGNIKGVLTEAFNKEFTFYESSPGQLVFTLPLKSPLADSSIIGQNSNIIEIYDGPTLVWAGIVSDYSGTEDTVTVTCDSFLYLFNYYFAKKASTNNSFKDYYCSNTARDSNAWSAIAINTIVNTIVTNAIAETNSLLGSSKCNVTIGTIEAPTAPASVSRLSNFNTVYALMGDLLAAANSASDAPVMEVTPQRVFNFWKNKNTDRPDTVFILGSNMLRIDWAERVSDVSNHVFGAGAGFWDKEIATEASDATSKAAYGAMFDILSRKDLSTTADLLVSLNDFIKDYKDPSQVYGFSVKTKLFDGWNLGDNIRVIAKNGLLNVDEYRRIVGVGVSDAEAVNIQIITDLKI